MRILHVIPSLDIEDGGPSVALRAIVRGLGRLGHDVVVATTGVVSNAVSYREDEYGKVEVHVFPRTMPRRWKFSWQLTRWLHRHVSEFDVVNVHAAFSYAAVPGCRFAMRANVPYVFRPLGTLDPWSLQQKRWKKRPYYALLERAHLAAAAAIHVTSERERLALEALGFGGKAVVIRLGVAMSEESRVVPVANTPGPGTPAHARGGTILFLSRLHEKKGLPLLFAAVQVLRREMPLLRLVVAGTGAASYEAELRALVAELEIADAVEFIGQVTGEAKESAFRSADVFALLSHTENFAIAVAEAMSHGLPVIVSDQVGVADLVATTRSGIVVALQLDRATEALRHLLTNAPARESMGANAKRAARDHLDWSRTCRELEALYARITDPAAPQQKSGRTVPASTIVNAGGAGEAVPVTVIVAVRNEAVNLSRCLTALKRAERIVVVDSGSTDGTPELAHASGAEVLQFRYSGSYPKKRQWALDNADLRTAWVMLIDADEVVTEALWEEISAALGSPSPCAAYLVEKSFHFMGRRFRHGGFSHSAVMLFQRGSAHFEQLAHLPFAAMDMEVHERMLVNGRIGRLENPLLHEDFKGLSAYVARHNAYATWEAAVRHEALHAGTFGSGAIRPRLFGNVQERRRFLKKIAMRVPGEAAWWFVYHYLLRLAILEGRRGLIASQIRAQYIALVRAKMYEMRVTGGPGMQP